MSIMKNMKVYWRKKHLPFDTYSLWAGLLLLSACIIRVVLIASGWPTTNSDEGTMGLMALHIAYRGDHPVFLYGNSYLGSLESYIGALLFLVSGPSLFALRLGLICIDIIFFYVMYRLTRLLYSKGMALFIVFLLCFGSTETLVRQLKVVGGTMEAMLFSALALLIATWLALTCQKSRVGTDSSRPSVPGDPVSTDGMNRSLRGADSHEDYQKNIVLVSVQRLLIYACYGLVIGLAMWSHLLLLPFIGAALLLLLLFCRSEMRRRVWLSLIVGFLIGFSPTIIFDIQHPLENALFTLVLQQGTGASPIMLPHSLWDQILGTVLISIPMATGFNTGCNLSADPGVWRSQLSSCLLPQGIWGVCYLIVVGIALVFAARELRRCYLMYKKSEGEGERRTLVYAVARALLLVSGCLTLLAYFRSPAPALVPLTSARYLVGLTVIVPTLIAPFWSTFSRIGRNTLRPVPSLLRRRGLALVSSLVLLLIVVNYAISLVTVFQQVPSVQATNQQQATMVNDLLHAHIVHFYSDYWTCNRVIFQSNERLICSVLDNQLQVGQNRYPPYQQIVQSDPNASYVFAVGSPQATAFARRASQSGATYKVIQMDGYVVYKL